MRTFFFELKPFLHLVLSVVTGKEGSMVSSFMPVPELNGLYHPAESLSFSCSINFIINREIITLTLSSAKSSPLCKLHKNMFEGICIH